MSIAKHQFGAGSDCTLKLPEECLVIIFQSPLLVKEDMDNCSLVCRRWLRIEGQARRRLSLSLSQHSEIAPSIPSIFARFDSVTDLTLQGGRLLGDEAVILIHSISLACRNLTRLTLHACDLSGVAAEAVIDTCVRLEMLSFVRVSMVFDDSNYSKELRFTESLKVICLDHVDTLDDNSFYRMLLIRSSKSLKTLKIVAMRSCLFLYLLGASLTELHLEEVCVFGSDLDDISSCCPDIEALCVVNFFGGCTDDKILMLSKRCNSLRALRIRGFWCPMSMKTVSPFFSECEAPTLEGIRRLRATVLVDSYDAGNCRRAGFIKMHVLQLSQNRLLKWSSLPSFCKSTCSSLTKCLGYI